MSASLMLHPCGNLSAVQPQQVLVKPIFAAAHSVGDVVRFDIGASVNSTYTDFTKLEDFDDPKCPFNVVVAGTAVANNKEGGIWGVVTEAAAAGNRGTVCIHGIVTAAVLSGATAIAIGDVLTPVANADLGLAADGIGPCVAIALAAGTANTTASIKVLFNGYAFGSASVPA